MKQSENNDNRLTYEQPKLRKHGTIHDMTLNVNLPGSVDTGSYANTPVS
ncbi:hypothetical protein [Nostoc sp. UHCC 0251]|nr:hypothetical protein [Nostoc sp. UHCC 0251]MEA5622972.1 hypothetical protein [Nostoc sp. UHCC 0251]